MVLMGKRALKAKNTGEALIAVREAGLLVLGLG